MLDRIQRPFARPWSPRHLAGSNTRFFHWLSAQITAAVTFIDEIPKLCTPSDFDYSPYFDIVKYPYFDADANGNYALIDWHDAAELDQTEKDFYVTSDKAP